MSVVYLFVILIFIMVLALIFMVASSSSKKPKNDSKVSFGISIVKNADGTDVFTRNFPNFGGYDEGTFHSFEKEAARILSEDPYLAILFQGGALLKVEVKNYHALDNFPTERVIMQIVDINDGISSRGLIKINRLRTRDDLLCTFKVRLLYSEVLE